jgi:23S rRNA (cytidine1920-2'-O)/16S rRNA (cytidine1409-2'-O)-methyltransferase
VRRGTQRVRGYAPAVPKSRLDALLVERGLFETRSRAAAAVLAGSVRLGSDGRPAEKPGQMVRDDLEVAVDAPPPFVSRGGTKLANGLDRLEIDPSGRRCLDVGASTGGFTDCLLKRGAAHVVALDVAYGELDWGLRNDPRVTVVERANARGIEPKILPYAPDFVVVDVSFISLLKVLPAALRASAPEFDCLALVKPQFEVGRDRVGKGGVVRSAELRREALTTVAAGLAGDGWSVLGFASSELPGPAGNRESFVWIAEPGRDGARTDLEAAAAEVEP